MANEFKPFSSSDFGSNSIDRNGNPVKTGEEYTFKPFGASGEAREFNVTDTEGLVGDKMGAPNPDEFDFRVTSYMDPYEVRARRQTAASKWGNASVKMLGLAGTTAIDGTLGTVIGLGNGIAQMAKGGSFGEGFINNPVSAALYDFTKKMEKEMPNYYTRKEQHSPWYNNLGTANFWADTMLKNTGFAIGAYLSGMGVSRGFAALTSGLTKKASKNIAGRMAKQLGKNEDEVLKMMKAGELPTNKLLEELKKDARLLKGINSTNQIASSTLGAVGESRIEALHMYHDTYDKIRRENPGISIEEANKQSVSAANMVFGLDMVTLSLGNYSQFRNAFSRGYEVNKRSMNAIQRSADDRLYKATGGRLETAKNIGAIALNPATEGMEEMQQFFNTQFSEKFIELQNDPEARNYVDNTIEALMFGFSESYGNIDTYDNFFAGFVTGGLGMPGVTTNDGKTQFQMQGGVFEGIRDYKEKNKNTDTAIKNLNEFMQDPEYQKRLAFLTRDLSLERTKQIALANEDLFNFKNAEDDQFLNMVLSFADAGKLEDLKSDIGDLSRMEVSDYRNLMSVDKKNLPEDIQKEMSEDQEKFDVFEGVEDTKIKEMLSKRATMMNEDINKILDIRDNLEIKAGNKINRALIPNLVHYAYTIDRGQKRLRDIKTTVLEELSKAFTTAVQTKAPLDTYGFVIDSSFKGEKGSSKRVLRILKEGETAIAVTSLTNEEKKQLTEKQAESDKHKKAQILSKREKPDTKGTSLFNFSILETGDESMFMEAFDNFAKENPFAAENVRDDVMDAVKMSQRLRTFTELYTETYRNNKSPEIMQRTYAESLKKLEEYKKIKAAKSFTVGSVVLHTDPKTGQKINYEIYSYDTKDGKTTYTLNEFVPGVGRDITERKEVKLEDLMGKDYSLVSNEKGVERFTIDFNEVNTYKLETKRASQFGYILDKRGKRVLVRLTADDLDSKRKGGMRKIKAEDLTADEKAILKKKNAQEPLVFRNLFGRAEKLLNKYFDPTLRDKLDRAIKTLNELAPNQNDAPLQAQIERIAGLFYTSTENGDLGYLASMYTVSALDEISQRLDGITNVYVREALRDKIHQRKNDIKKVKEELIKEYGMAFDRLWAELEAKDRGLAASSIKFAKDISDFEEQLKEMSLQKITDTKSISHARRAIASLKKNLEVALEKGDTKTSDKILNVLVGYEAKINGLKKSLELIKESSKGIRESIEKEKKDLKKIKEDLNRYERAIERLEEFRADLDKDVKYFSLEEVLEMIEDMLPESKFVPEFEKRVYDLPNLGLSSEEKIDFLTKEAQKAEAESEELTGLRVASEEAADALKTEEAIQANVQSTPEGADRIRDLKRKADNTKQLYLEKLEEEKPYVQDRNEQATSVKAGVYKSAGIPYNDPSTVGVFPTKDIEDLRFTVKTMKDELKQEKIKDANGKLLDVDALSDELLRFEYIRVQRRKIAELGKEKFVTLFRNTGRETEVTVSADEVYADKVESIRALGIPIEDAVSLEDLRALHKNIDSEIKEREIAIRMIEEMLADVDGVIKTLEENLNAIGEDTPAGLAKANKIAKTLLQFEDKRKAMIERMIHIGAGLRKERQKRAEIADLEHRKELMDFLDVMKVARAKVNTEKRKKDKSKKDGDGDPTAENDDPTTIEKAGSIASPGEVETDPKGEDKVKEANKDSAKPSYWEVFNRNAGSDMPGDMPNPIKSQRRYHRWLQFNPDVARKSKVELFQSGDNFLLQDEDIEGFDQTEDIWGTVITYKDGKKKYVNADNSLSDVFDSTTAIYFKMPSSKLERTEYGEKYREPTRKEIASRFGLAESEMTEQEFEDYKEREIKSLKDNYQAKRESWVKTIGNSQKENPILTISEITQGIPIENETVAPSTVKEFFGHNDVTIRVATGDIFEIGGRTIKTTPGHTIVVDNKTKNFVRLRPRTISDTEVETVVNIFKTYARRHTRNEGDHNILKDANAHHLRDNTGAEIDPSTANLFSLLNDIVWWQGNNLNNKGEEINTNPDTKFHFISKSGVPGGKIRIGNADYNFIGEKVNAEGKKELILNPEVETAVRAFLQSRYRQITSRRFNAKNRNKEYTHIASLNNDRGMVMPNHMKTYDSYTDFIISDRSQDGRPIAEVRMKKVDKPTTSEGYNDAEITFANRRLVFNYELDSYKKEEEKKNKARAKANKTAKKKADAAKKAQPTQDTAPDAEGKTENPDAAVEVAGGDTDWAGSFAAHAVESIAGGDYSGMSGHVDELKKSMKQEPGSSKAPPKKRGQRRIKDSVFSGYENTDQMEKWFRSKFPKSVGFKRVLKAVNGSSWGEFSNGIVTVMENAAEGTTFHEAFHVVMSEFLSEKEYKALIEEFLQRPNAEQLIADKAKVYSDYSREGIIEEILADEFAEYELSGGTKKIPSPAQKSFFQELLDFIKAMLGMGKPSIHEVYHKLSKGYYATAKPNVRSKAVLGARQKRFETESSPLTNEFIKVVNRKFFGFANTKFREEFDSYLAGDLTKAGVLDKIYNAIKEDLEGVRKTIIKEIDTKAEGYEIAEKQLQNLDRFLDKWDVNESYTEDIDKLRNSFKEFHRTNILSRFDVFTELDIDEIKDEESKDSGSNTWAFNSMTRSAVESASRRLRLFLAGLPETHKGQYFTYEKLSEDFGEPTAMSFGKAFAIYSNLLANTRTIEEAYHIIVKNQETTPGAAFLLEELKLKKLFSSDSNQGLTNSELQLITDFSQSFNLQKMDYSIAAVGKHGSGAVMNASQDSQKNRILMDYRNNERIMATMGSQYVTVDPTTDRVKYTGIIPVTDLRGTKAEVDTKKRQVYQSVGIEFTDEVWDALPIDGEVKNLQNVDTILNKMLRKEMSIYEKESKMGIQLGLLTDGIIKVDPDKTENSHLNLDGSRVYDNILHNYVSFITSGLNQAESLEKLEQQYPFFKSAYLNNSKLLNHILFDEDGNRNSKRNLKIDLGEGARTEDKSVKKEFSAMTPSEKFKFVLDMSTQNKFMMIRAGSNGNERFISFGDVKMGQAGNLRVDDWLGLGIKTPRVVADMIGYAKDELAYIAEIRSMSKQYKFSKIFEDADTAIDSSPVLKMLSKNINLYNTIKTLIETKNTSTEMLEGIDIKLFSDQNPDAVATAERLIQESITLEAEELARKAIKLGLVEETTGGRYINLGVPQVNDSGLMMQVESFESFNSLRDNMSHHAASFMISQIEQQKIFAGHPAQYVKEDKVTQELSVDNMIKRMSGMIGPKKASVLDSKWWRNVERLYPNLGGMSRLYMDKDGNINETLTEDSKPVLKSLILEDIQARNLGLAEYFEEYGDMNEADAQGYVHLDTYRDMLLTNGMWNLGLEKLYQWEMSNRKPTVFKWNGENISVKSEADLINEAGKEVSFNPLKPQYFGPLAELGYVTSMYKLSVIPLIPSVIGEKKLNKMSNFMALNNTGMIVYESGNKVGTATNEDGSLTKLYDENGKVGFNLRSKSHNLPYQHIYYEFFGIQVSTGNTRKDTTSYGSQVHKQIMYEVHDGTNYRDMSFPELGIDEKSSVSTEKVMNHYLDLVGSRIKMGAASLRRRLGMVKMPNGTYEIEDVDKTIELLKNLVAERDLPQEYIKAFDSLKVDGKITPLGITVMPAKGDVERALFAIADKMTVKSKMKGAGLIQVANSGWEEVGVTRNYNDGKFNSNQLKFYTKTDSNKKVPTKKASKAVLELFKENPELSKLGTPEEYQAYMESIGVTEIAHHHSESDISEFKTFPEGYFPNELKKKGTHYKEADDVVFFVKEKLTEEFMSKRPKVGTWGLKASNILQFNGGQKVGDGVHPGIDEGVKKGIDEGYDAVDFGKIRDNKTWSKVIAILNPKNAHRLGSKKDIQGFKNFKKVNKQRVTRMQVYVPHYFKEILGDIKEGENVILDDRLKKLLGFRIPTSGLNSIDSIEIAGFLPAHAGDMIVLPTEIVAKAGSDYDVDKLTVYYPHYTVGKNADGITELRYLEFYTTDDLRNDPNKVNELKNRVRNQIISDDPILRKKIKDIESEYDAAYIEELKGEKKAAYSDFMKADAVQDFIEKFNLDPNRANKRELEKRFKGLRRTITLLNKMSRELEQYSGEDRMGFTNEMFFLENEDPMLVASNFKEDMSNDEALDAIDRIITTAQTFEAELEVYYDEDSVKARAEIQKNIEEATKEMKKRISELVKPEVDEAFSTMTLFERNGKKAVENEINRTMQGIVLSPENYEKLIEPIGSGILKKISEDIKRLKKQKAKADTVEDLLKMSWSLETIERYLQGKKGVGIGALQSINELLGQKARWAVNENHKLTYFNSEEGVYTEFDAALKFPNNNIGGAPILFGNDAFAGTQEELSKMRIMNNFINGYVDIEADPFIIDINAGLDMAPPIMFMVRAGVPIRTALYFANQPIIIEMMDAFRSQGNNMISVANSKKVEQGEIIEAVYKKYSGKENLVKSEIDIISDESLEKYLDPDNQKMSDEAFRKDQLLILDQFIKLRAMGGELSNAVNIINYDTKGTGGLAAATLVRKLALKKIKENNFIQGFDTAFKKGNYLKDFKDSVEAIPEMFKPFFPEFNRQLAAPAIEMQFEEYYKDQRLGFDTMVNMMDIFMQDMMLSLVMKMPLKGKTTNLTEEIRNLLVTDKKEGNPSVALELKAFVEKFPEVAKNNPFIERISPIFNETGGDRILMYDQPSDPSEIDDVIDGWRELFRINDERIRNFAAQLAKVAIIQTGFRNHPVGLTKHIPAEYLADLLNNAFDQYKSMGIGGQRVFKNFSMIDSILGNYTNSNILPRRGRVALKLKYTLKAEYLGENNKKKREEAQAAGINIFNKRIVQAYKTKVGENEDGSWEMEDKLMPIFEGGKVVMIPMEQYMSKYVVMKGRGILALFTELSNRKILKGSMHTKKRGKALSQNPLHDKAPELAPDTEGDKKLIGKKAVIEKKDTNGTENTCEK